MTNLNKPAEDFQANARGRIRETGIFIGTVKNVVDVQKMGRLEVYIPEFGGDPADGAHWITVSYASPFAGATPVDDNTPGGTKMVDTQQSYGFWMVPPDVGNQVLCCFINGDISRGFWFACVWQQFMNHMVPGIALNKSTDDGINGQTWPPVCEYNKKDASIDQWDPKRPVFDPLYEGVKKQGLETDPERGFGTTSARRESPSEVFGFVTPRGNSIHIDDEPDNEFIRLRTRSGVQLLIHDTTGYIYMISKEGNSWLEISDEGIDMYTKRSISMRAEENINIHADQSVITNGGGVHNSAGNATNKSDGRTTSESGGPSQEQAEKIKKNSEKDYDNTPGGKAGAGSGVNNAYGKDVNTPAGAGRPTAQEHYDHLRAKGATHNEALMLTGAAASESNFNPRQSHDSGTGYGLYGHRLDRLTKMQEFAGTSTPSWQQQSEFALQELRGRQEGRTINQASTPYQLAVAQMHFERPVGYKPNNPTAGHNFDGRLSTIEKFGKNLNSGGN